MRMIEPFLIAMAEATDANNVNDMPAMCAAYRRALQVSNEMVSLGSRPGCNLNNASISQSLPRRTFRQV